MKAVSIESAFSPATAAEQHVTSNADRSEDAWQVTVDGTTLNARTARGCLVQPRIGDRVPVSAFTR